MLWHPVLIYDIFMFWYPTSWCFDVWPHDFLNVGWHCTESKAGDRGGEEQGTGQDEAELDKGTPLLTSQTSQTSQTAVPILRKIIYRWTS